MKRLGTALLIIVALLSLSWSLRKTLWLPYQNEREAWGDFSAYYMAGYCAARDVPLYDLPRVREHARYLGIGKGPPHFGYPPLTALFFIPVAARLDPVAAFRAALVAYQILLWLSVAIIMLTLRIRFTLVRTALLVTAVAWFTPVWTTLQSGQINMVILLLVSLGLLAWSRTKPWITGSLFAAAAMIKLFPGAVVVYFALRRRWRALAAMTVVCVLLLVLSLAVLGFQDHRYYLFEEMPKNAAFVHGGEFNAAVNSLVYRVIHHQKLTPEIAAGSTAASRATLVARLLILLITIIFLFVPLRDGPEMGLRRICLLLTAAMMVNAWTWTHHLVLALPCLAVAGWSILAGRRSLFSPAGILLLISYGLMAIGYRVPLHSALNGIPRELIRSSSLNFYGLVLLFVMLVMSIMKGRDDSSS